MSRKGGLPILLALCLSGRLHAAITTADLSVRTPAYLVNALLGGGVTVSNVVYTGSYVAAGTFAGGATSIGFDSGIILSTGNVANVTGPNTSSAVSTENGTPGDSILGSLAGQQTFDAASLEFDFVPVGNVIVFDYVFASDEYNEFVGLYNDVFGFFLDGVNIAFVPGTKSPVSVNTVNAGFNSQDFRNNDIDIFGLGHCPYDTEMDGLTIVFTVTATVTPAVSHHIRLAIADVADDRVDSNVFIRASSFRIPEPGVTLIKRAPATVNLGGSITFSLTLSVTGGGGDITNVTVWDTVPPGTTFTDATGGGFFDGSVVSWNLGTISGSQEVDLSFTVTIGGSLAFIQNAGQYAYTFNSQQRGPSNSNAVIVFPVMGSPVLTMQASTAGPVCAGDPLRYTVGWRNAGQGTIWGLTITDTLPAGVAWSGPAEVWAKPDWLGFPRLSASAWAPDASGPWEAGPPPAGTEPAVVRWVVDRVAPGMSGFVRFRTTVSATTPPPTGLIVNAASATQPWDDAVTGSNQVSTQAGSALTVSLSAFPAVRNSGQPFWVTLTANNGGCADALSPVLWGPTPGGSAGVTFVDGPNPAVPGSIPAGGAVTFTWTVTGTPGDVVFQGAVTGTDGYTGVPVGTALESSGVVHIQMPAALSAILSVSPASVCVGEKAVAALNLLNTGETSALGVAPGPLKPAGPATVVAGPTPGLPVTIPGGGSVVFSWTVQGSAPGIVLWSVTAAGTDAVSGAGVTAGPAGASWSLTSPGTLVAALSVPPAASVGQWVTVTLTVTHAGGSPVTGVSPAGLAWPAGFGTLVSGPAPGPATLVSGGSRSFSWTFSVSGAGTIGFSSTAGGTTCTGPVSAPVAAASVGAVLPAALKCAVALSASVVVAGQWVSVTVTLTDTGGATATGVTPSLAVGGAPGTLTGGPAPPSVAALAPGAGASFVWTFSASGAGTVTFTGGGSAADALSGRTVTAAPTTASLLVLAPAHLSLVSFAINPSVAGNGDSVSAVLTVRNDGGVAASVTAATAAATAPAILTGMSGPSPGPPVPVAAGGTASFTWAGTAGSCGYSAATATVTGVEVATGRALSPVRAASGAVAVYGTPTVLSLDASPRSAPASTPVTLVATLHDTCGLGVPGRLLSFTVSTGGGSLSPSTATTDAGGEARVTLTLGLEAGPNAVAVALASPALSATAVVTATRGLLTLETPGGALSANAFSPYVGETVLVRLFLLNNDPVAVRIYTASGRLVRTLRSTRPIGGGQVSVVWDGKTEDEFPVARGVYIVRVTGGGLNDTLKVVVR